MSDKTTEQAAEEIDYRAEAVLYTCNKMGNIPTSRWIDVRDAYEAGYELSILTITSQAAEIEKLRKELKYMAGKMKNHEAFLYGKWRSIDADELEYFKNENIETR